MKVSLKNKELVQFDGTTVAIEKGEELVCEAGTGEDKFLMKVLDLSFNKIHVLLGMRCLTNLTDLDISHNSLTGLTVPLPPSLKRLRASNNFLTEVPSLEALKGLKWLDLSENNLSTLSGRCFSNTLTSLYVSGNKLTNLQFVAHLNHLITFHFAHNNISHLQEVSALGGLPNLRNIAVEGNTVAVNPSLFSALQSIVKLTTLDGMTLSQAHANRCVRLFNKRAEEAGQRREISEQLNTNRSILTSRELLDDEVEIRRLEARARELENLVREENAVELSLKKRNEQLRAQLKQTDDIIDQQDFHLGQLGDKIAALEEEQRHLRSSAHAVDSAFRVKHGAVMHEKLKCIQET